MSADAGDGASLLSKGFTSWKFDLIDAMLSDPELSSADFRIAVAVLQRVNQFTRAAIITDHRLQQLVPRDRKAFQVARTRLVELGWWEVRTGSWSRATEYRFFDERAKRLENIRLDARILTRETDSDSELETPRKKQRNKAKSPHDQNPHNEEKPPHNARGEKIPHSSPHWGENTSHSGEKSHPLHLQTPRSTLSVKGRVSTRAYDAHVQAYDLWERFEEMAARLEYDEELPRDEAEHRARILFGLEDASTDDRDDDRAAQPTVANREPRRNTR